MSDYRIEVPGYDPSPWQDQLPVPELTTEAQNGVVFGDQAARGPAITWEPADEPALGPERPPTCVDGIESHQWRVSIEEGQLTLHSGCELCDAGIQDMFDDHDFELRPVMCTLTVEVEGGGDSTYVWVDLQPKEIPTDE